MNLIVTETMENILNNNNKGYSKSELKDKKNGYERAEYARDIYKEVKDNGQLTPTDYKNLGKIIYNTCFPNGQAKIKERNQIVKDSIQRIENGENIESVLSSS